MPPLSKRVKPMVDYSIICLHCSTLRLLFFTVTPGDVPQKDEARSEVKHVVNQDAIDGKEEKTILGCSA
jgi:hypothetical protein